MSGWLWLCGLLWLAGGCVRIDGPPPATIEFGPRNSARFKDYAAVDLRVSRLFALPRGDLSVFAEVTNAFDRRNPCCIDFFELEREYRHWLPLVPSIGVLWRY